MTTDEIRSTLRGVFFEVFENDRFEFSDALARDQVEGWDSLGHIRLVAATEEAFDMRFTIEEIESFTSVGRMVERIAARR
ncbi:MAG: acyl carrier protein [Steroidobacteraceae bacterium]